MKLSKQKNIVAILLISALLLFSLAGCKSGSTAASTDTSAAPGTSQTVSDTSQAVTETSQNPEAKVLRVAYRQSDVPMTYQGDDGKPTGSLSEIFAIAAEYLESKGYQIEYFPTSNDDLNLGLAAGDYDVGLFNAAYTEERAETYVFPTEYFGASKLVAIVRNENADVKTVDEVIAQDLKVTPVAPNNGITFALEQWNIYNPDNQIKLTYRDDSATDTSIEDVANGKYDVNFTLAVFWDARVVAEDGIYHQYQDDLIANFVLAMKTYPMLSKATVGADEEFVALFSEALRVARNDPRTPGISEKYYGDNFLEYPYGEGW